jgi:FHA domain-containing protein/type VI secretion system protein
VAPVAAALAAATSAALPSGVAQERRAVPRPAAVPASTDAAALLGILAQSMGLQPGDLDPSKPEATMRVVGELLRLSLDGLYRMLEMRSQLKSELRIEDRTMIASRENNPLKHSDSLNDALTYLVDVRQHGNKLFMPPSKAVEDAVWDICAHEMALMAGTRAALLASLKLFSPEAVEGRIKKSGALDAVLPALHKSKLWERFLEMYASLEREAEDHFDRLLNQEFAKAYSEQSKKLRKKK